MRGLLVYPISIDLKEGRGILRKMDSQTRAFEALGMKTTQVCNSRSGLVINGEPATRYLMADTRLGGRLDHYTTFYLHTLRNVDAEEYDFVYVRYPLSTPFFLLFLASLKRRNPHLAVVVEIPTFPYRQELNSGSLRWLRTSDDVLHHMLRLWVDRVVTFFGQDEIYGIPAYATSNGIELIDLPVRARHPAPCETVRLLGVANLARWHGYDRVIRGMAERPARGRRVVFEIAGRGPEYDRLRNLAYSLDLGGDVVFHGVVVDRDLDALFDQADVAIGSLAMHRLGLGTASSLKTREYCARGIPFVLGCPDADFPRSNSVPWFEVPPTDDPVDVAALVAFADRALANDPTASMREYAEANLTWTAKLRPLVAALRQRRGCDPAL